MHYDLDYVASEIRNEIVLEGPFHPQEHWSRSNEEMPLALQAAREAMNEAYTQAADSNTKAGFELTAFNVLRFLVASKVAGLLTASREADVDERRVYKVISKVYGWRFNLLPTAALLAVTTFSIWGLFFSQIDWWHVIIVLVIISAFNCDFSGDEPRNLFRKGV